MPFIHIRADARTRIPTLSCVLVAFCSCVLLPLALKAEASALYMSEASRQVIWDYGFSRSGIGRWVSRRQPQSIPVHDVGQDVCVFITAVHRGLSGRDVPGKRYKTVRCLKDIVLYSDGTIFDVLQTSATGGNLPGTPALRYGVPGYETSIVFQTIIVSTTKSDRLSQR